MSKWHFQYVKPCVRWYWTGEITSSPVAAVFNCSFCCVTLQLFAIFAVSFISVWRETVTKQYKTSPFLSLLQTAFYSLPINSHAVSLLCIHRMDALSSQSLFKLCLSHPEGHWMKNSDVRPEFLYVSRNVSSTSKVSCLFCRDEFIYQQKTVSGSDISQSYSKTDVTQMYW